MYNLAAVFVAQYQSVQIVFTEYIFDEAVTVQDGASGRIVFITHDGAEDLEDGRDAAAAADHGEFVDFSLDAVDGAAAAAEVFEFANGAFEVDGVAEGEGVHGFAHFAAWGGLGGKVELDEDVEVAFAGDFGNGCVGADDGFAVDGVPEADHEMLTHG